MVAVRLWTALEVVTSGLADVPELPFELGCVLMVGWRLKIYTDHRMRSATDIVGKGSRG